MIDLREEDAHIALCGDPDLAKPLLQGTPVLGEGGLESWLCPAVVPSPPPQDSCSGKLARGRGKGCVGESRGLGGNGCPLISRAVDAAQKWGRTC